MYVRTGAYTTYASYARICTGLESPSATGHQACVLAIEYELPWHRYDGTWTVHDVYQEHVCIRTFAPSLNWLMCILPEHTWFSVPMRVLFQPESCDITFSPVRTYIRTRYTCTYHGTNGTYHGAWPYRSGKPGTRQPVERRSECRATHTNRAYTCMYVYVPTIPWKCVMPQRTYVRTVHV